MRIAYICRNYHKRGGISKCIAELAERLVENNEVHIFSNSWEDISSDKIIFHKVWMVKKPLFLAVFSFAIFSYFKLRKYSFDLICSPTGGTLVPSLFTAHSCHKSWVEYKKRSLKEFILYLINPFHHIVLNIERYNYKRGNYNKIIAISEYIKREIIRGYKVYPKDISVIYNGVNISEFHPENKFLYRDQIRAKWNIADTDVVLLFIGYEFKRKGVKYLVKAISRLPSNPHSVLLIVGGGDKRFYSGLVRKLGLSDRVIFAGATKEIKKYYAASDIFVFPTLLEPFGLVITEAMACGLAVITNKSAGAAEIITNGYDGLLLDDPADTGELVKKIELFVKNNGLRDKIGQNARQTIKRYSWDVISKQTEEFYRRVVGNKKKFQ